MTRLHIKIKDADKAIIVVNLLKELPFVEIEENKDTQSMASLKGKGSLSDLFGIWEKRDITLSDIRKKAWTRTHDHM